MSNKNGITLYYCDCWDSSCDIGEHYTDAFCYVDKAAAERRAKRLTYTDDCVNYYASVRAIDLVDVRSIERY